MVMHSVILLSSCGEERRPLLILDSRCETSYDSLSAEVCGCWVISCRLLREGEGQDLIWVLAYLQPEWVRWQLEGTELFLSHMYFLNWLWLLYFSWYLSTNQIIVYYYFIINLIRYLFQFTYSLFKDCIHFNKGGWKIKRDEKKKQIEGIEG